MAGRRLYGSGRLFEVADAETTQIYRHYAPDPTHGAAFVERAFGSGDAQRTIASGPYPPESHV